MLAFENQNLRRTMVWPYLQNANYLVVVVGEGRAGRSMGVGLHKDIEKHIVIFTDTYEVDALFPAGREGFFWEAFRHDRIQTRCEVKERLRALGFDPCAVDRLWPENQEE